MSDLEKYISVLAICTSIGIFGLVSYYAGKSVERGEWRKKIEIENSTTNRIEKLKSPRIIEGPCYYSRKIVYDCR